MIIMEIETPIKHRKLKMWLLLVLLLITGIIPFIFALISYPIMKLGEGTEWLADKLAGIFGSDKISRLIQFYADQPKRIAHQKRKAEARQRELEELAKYEAEISTSPFPEIKRYEITGLREITNEDGDK